MTPLELLAPARDAEIARQAILHGADAVYMAGPSHGARAAASNSLQSIRDVARFAHQYGCRLYVPLNTIIYDDELDAVRRLIHDYWEAGADALIVQDMGILRMEGLPPIALHASTQCDIRTPQKAAFLAACGFEQVVIPREFSLKEIAETRRALPTDVAIEAFVHGALCVCYSGDCQASQVALGRSANRGECAQMCRMAYDLTDARGNVLIRSKHLLSLRDMRRLESLEDMALAGVSSFKVEGRLKDAAYVKQVVGAYRHKLDEVIANNPFKFCRASWGKSSLSFTPDASKAFNRSFTPYFLCGTPAKMASIDTPKSIGEKVGTVTAVSGNCISARLSADLANGDGLGFFNKQGQFAGFRLNSIKDSRLFAASPVEGLAPGATLYRNLDSRLSLALAAPNTATRTIHVSLALWQTPAGLALRMEIPSGPMAIATAPYAPQEARTPQIEVRRRQLGRLGDTIFAANSITDSLPPSLFVPSSLLASLRRDAADLLLATILTSHRRSLRRPERKDAPLPAASLSYHDNIANRLARQFYADHGASATPATIELQKAPPSGTVVMTTRYCLRRELGACLRSPDAKKLPSPIFLKNRAACFQLHFDCENCQMQVLTSQK